MSQTLPLPLASKLRRTIACAGDSITENLSLGNFLGEFWPAQLEALLTSRDTITDGLAPNAPLNCRCKCRNFGHAGNTSGPYAAASALCNTVTSNTALVFTSISGTFKAGQTVLIQGQMAELSAYSGGNATLYAPGVTGLTSGHNYPVVAISDWGADQITRMSEVMGSKTPKELDLLIQRSAPEYDAPDIFALWIGHNDPANSIVGLNGSTTIKSAPSLSAPQWPAPSSGGTTLITLQTGQGASFTIGQLAVIVDWSKNPPRVWLGLVVNIAGDTIYLSQNTHALDQNYSNWINWMAAGPNPLPNLPPVGASVYQGTQANIVAAVLLAAQYAGVIRFAIGNTMYKNFSSGGDTLASPEATYATLRTNIADAVNLLQNNGPELDVHLVDVYGLMRTRIVNGDTWQYRSLPYTAVQGDSAWHSIANNQHLNPLGENLAAFAFLQTFQSAGWLDFLRP